MTEPIESGDEQLSPGAEQWLARLRQGDGRDIAVPSVYAGAMAFGDHAEAYLSNAAQLCRNPEAHDFCIFGALYGIRHGLELWLKCLVINSMIDTANEEISSGVANVDSLALALGLVKREHKQHLYRSLCVLRNCCEDGLVHPDCVQQNIDAASADRALQFFRNDGNLERFKLAQVWTVPVPGHDILRLWQKVEGWVRELSPEVSANAQISGCGNPMPPDDLVAICELIHRWDPGGDTFRYPSSLDGHWNTDLPSLNLKTLGDLAEALQETVLGYDNFLEGSYSSRS